MASIASGFPRIGSSAENAPDVATQVGTRSAQNEIDLVLMRRLQAGDKDVLSVLFDRYARLVMSVGLRILRDLSEAEELVQDVFLYVFNKCAIFDPQKSDFRSWLVQIAYCRGFDRRQYLINRRFYDYRNIEDVVESVSSNAPVENPEEVAKLKQLCERAFAELTQRQRKMLELFFFEGYSLREISSQMDETLAATRHNYYRALEKLKAARSLASSSGTNHCTNGDNRQR